MKGLIHCYTGDGKGKTSAALGLTLRAAGSGKRVLFAQFLKDGSSSELRELSHLKMVSCLSMKEHFGFYWTLTEEEKRAEQVAVRNYFSLLTERAEAERFDMLVLDEFMAAYRLELLDRAEALRWIQHKPETLELVLTGRDAPEEIRALSDYVTECRKEKHPFDRGIAARQGIEY